MRRADESVTARDAAGRGMDTWFRWEGGDLILAVRVQPNARRDEIIGPHGTRLRIRLTAPAREGKANAHLVRYLAGRFGVSRRQVVLLAGERAREKRLRIVAPGKLPDGIPGPC